MLRATKPLPRPELASLRRIPNADQRLFLRFYLRSNMEQDQEEARKRCELYGIDYEQARAEARRS